MSGSMNFIQGMSRRLGKEHRHQWLDLLPFRSNLLRSHGLISNRRVGPLAVSQSFSSAPSAYRGQFHQSNSVNLNDARSQKPKTTGTNDNDDDNGDKDDDDVLDGDDLKTPYPHEDHSLEGKYSTALYRVCVQKKILESVWKDLESLRTCITESKDFKLFLEAPGISLAQKVGVIKEMSKRFHLSETTTNFLHVVLENRRLSLLTKMIDSFEAFYRAARGEINCLVISATPLSEEQRQKVKESLEQRNARHRLMIGFSISPSLLGGLVVRLGHQTLDYSVASRLALLQTKLLVPLAT